METVNKGSLIDTSLKIDELVLIKHLQNSEFLPNIKIVYNKVSDLLDNRIAQVFDTYTLHNSKHSFRIMEYMAEIVGNLSELSELEVTLLVYSAILHDIGMAVSETDIELIKADKFSFCDIKYSSMKKFMNNNEDVALKEYIRKFHSTLSAKYIKEILKDDFKIPGQITANFAEDLALICESHTKDFDWIIANLTQHDKKGNYNYNSQFIACILRLSDILDIDSSRTPYNLYGAINPSGISDDEWKQHFIISNTDKIEYDKVTNQKKLVFHGNSYQPNLHRKILSYIDWVKVELQDSMELVNKMPTQYNLLFDPTPKVNIKPNGFTFSEYKMSLDYKAISKLLMGEKIYGNKSLGLRELIQNSLDSCKVRQEIESRNYQFGDEQYQPKIKIILNQKNNTVIIKDYGIGMSMEIIKKHFLNIGVSYYNSNNFKLRDFNYKPIGNFGIGFLSCFMLSNNVKVITREYKSKHKFTVDLEKNNEYTSLNQEDNYDFEGTEVILDFNVFIGVFYNSVFEVKEFLQKYFLTDGVKLELVDMDSEKVYEITNHIDIPNPEGTYKINIGNYLKDIEGYAIIRNNKDYISNIFDLDFDGELYLYNDIDGLQKVDNTMTIMLNEYISDNIITYISIPLVEKDLEEKFLNGMKFTNSDLDDVIEKLRKDLKWISVIVKTELQDNIVDHNIEDDSPAIFEKITLTELQKLGHSSKCITSISKETINLFEGKNNELYLPFEEEERHMYYYKDKKRKELFVRNVLIKEFLYNFPFSASIFEIESLIININSRDFVPEISRNDFDLDTRKDINYIVGKAIHQGALESFELTEDKKKTLKNFIQTYYATATEFEK